MLALAGHALGVRCRVWDPAPDSCARPVAEHLSSPYEAMDVLEHFSSDSEVVTYEFENVPIALVEELERRGVPVFPPSVALRVASDRLQEKLFVASLGGGVPRFQPVQDRQSLEQAIENVGFPAVLKARRWGYDGKGQARVASANEARRAWELMGRVPCLLEAWVPFKRELSQLAVRGQTGEIAFYPLVETRQRSGILFQALAPAAEATGELIQAAQSLAQKVAEALNYVGVFAIELFETQEGILFNELAPRVHNSGHWTIEGSVTSQFENHLRAILGWPLGSTALRAPSALRNFVGEIPHVEKVLELQDAHIHLYGKAPRPGRKLGHITLLASEEKALEGQLAELEKMLDGIGTPAFVLSSS